MPHPGPQETETQYRGSMTDPHAESDIRKWRDRLGRSETYLSQDLARRMGLSLRLVRPALEQLSDWQGTPIEMAVYDAIHHSALRFHPRFIARYLRLQDMWPAEALSLGGLFLLRILEEGSFASHEITFQMSQALAGQTFQDGPPAIINAAKSAEIDRRFDELRRQDWKGASLFGEKRQSIPENERAMGTWVRIAFNSLFGEEEEGAKWDREALAMTLVDEASPEMARALQGLERKGWRASRLLAFLLKENVSQPAWSEIQRNHIQRFGNGPGGDEPILSIAAYFDFLQELVEELVRAHAVQAMEQDPAFQAAVSTALDAAQGWEAPSLVDVYTTLMTRTEWKNPTILQAALEKARQSPTARLHLGRRLIETALKKLGDEVELDRFSASFTELPAFSNHPPGSPFTEYSSPGSDNDRFKAAGETGQNLYYLAMGWISAIHGRMGIKDAERAMEGIGLAMEEFSQTEVEWVMEAGDFDQGVILDVGALLHWGTLEDAGAREHFTRNYRETTGREGWFRYENAGNFNAVRKIIERRLSPQAGLFI